MLGVGWTEMLVIGVVALIVIGPKDLPDLMRKVGRFAGTVRRMGQDFQRELNKTTGLNEITNLRQSVSAPLKATADAIRKEFNTTTSTGAVQPSGALKPTDPKVESVVDDIKAKAGMAPVAPLPLTAAAAAAAKAAEAAPATAAKTSAPAAKKAAPRLKKVAADTPVTVTDAPPIKRPRVAKAAAAPAEPAPAKAKRAPAKAKPVAEPAPAVATTPAARANPAAKRPAAKKPAKKAE